MKLYEVKCGYLTKKNEIAFIFVTVEAESGDDAIRRVDSNAVDGIYEGIKDDYVEGSLYAAVCI